MDNIFNINIKFKNSSPQSYVIDTPSTILGRQFSNNSTQITVIKPEEERNNICLMYVFKRYEDNILDLFVIEDKPIFVTNHLSKETAIRIMFKFLNLETDYDRRSNTVMFTFIQGINVDEVPIIPPQEQPNFLKLYFKAFTNSKFDVESNELIFLNIDKNEVRRVKLPIVEAGNGIPQPNNGIDEYIVNEKIEAHNVSLMAHNDIRQLIDNNRINISALQSEATAKWVLLNTVDSRSRDNVTAINDLKQQIGNISSASERGITKPIIVYELPYNLIESYGDIRIPKSFFIPSQNRTVYLHGEEPYIFEIRLFNVDANFQIVLNIDCTTFSGFSLGKIGAKQTHVLDIYSSQIIESYSVFSFGPGINLLESYSGDPNFPDDSLLRDANLNLRVSLIGEY